MTFLTGQLAYRAGPGVRVAPGESVGAGDLDVSTVRCECGEPVCPVGGAEPIVTAAQDQQRNGQTAQRILQDMPPMGLDGVHEPAYPGPFPFRLVRFAESGRLVPPVEAPAHEQPNQ